MSLNLSCDCIEHDVSRRVQLLQQVKANNVARQHRTSILSSCFKKQCIIQNAMALLSSVSLGPGQHARQYSSFSPYLCVWRDRPVARAPVDHSSNLLDDFSCPGVGRIEQTTGGCEFRLRNRGVPGFGRPEHPFPVLRKAALKNVDVDRRIVKQLGGPLRGRSEKLKL